MVHCSSYRLFPQKENAKGSWLFHEKLYQISVFLDFLVLYPLAGAPSQATASSVEEKSILLLGNHYWCCQPFSKWELSPVFFTTVLDSLLRKSCFIFPILERKYPILIFPGLDVFHLHRATKDQFSLAATLATCMKACVLIYHDTLGPPWLDDARLLVIIFICTSVSCTTLKSKGAMVY